MHTTKKKPEAANDPGQAQPATLAGAIDAVDAGREEPWISAHDAAVKGLVHLFQCGCAAGFCGLGGHGSDLLTGLHAQDIPSHVGSQFLAKHGLTLVAGCSFDQRAVLRREAAVGVQPGPNVAPVLVIEDAGQSSLTTQNLCGADQSGLFGGDLHWHG